MVTNPADKNIVVITGGPGTGKTSLIEALKKKGFFCFEEISRQTTREAREEGIAQLFLTDPLLFSKRLIEGRKNQYLEALKKEQDPIFLDRGIPDVLAYMDYKQTPYPTSFKELALKHRYQKVFSLPPWKDIYHSDNERYENFEQSQSIHKAILKTYQNLGYLPIEVPLLSVGKRRDFVIDSL